MFSDFIASTHAYILFFTTRGRAHWLKVHEIPEASRAAKGKAMVNLLSLGEGEQVATCVPVRDLPRYVGLYRQGRLPVNKLLTHRIELAAINEGFDRLHEGKAIRQVVVFK